MAEANSKGQKGTAEKGGLTPLMQQYREIKARYKDAILFFRLGDFYEMFADDAREASALLELTLTKRQEYPMCGVPYHAAPAYIKRLVKAGRKVAICEQLENPSAIKGLVKRDVVRLITSGTIIEDSLLEAGRNNFLAACCFSDDQSTAAVAYIDISTGEFCATETTRDKAALELARLSPQEIIAPASLANSTLIKNMVAGTKAAVTTLDDYCFLPAEAETRLKETLHVQSMKPLGLEGRSFAARACGAIITYLERTQLAQMPPLSTIRYYSLDDYMLLDPIAIRNLELLEGASGDTKGRSLLNSIDETVTPMGARLLRQYLLRPLISTAKIKARQNAVAYFIAEGMARRDVRELLTEVTDIERIVNRVANGTANPREVQALRHALEAVPRLKDACRGSDVDPSLSHITARLLAPDGLSSTIFSAIADEPPLTLKEGGVIKTGYNAELDEIRSVSTDSKQHISAMETRERVRTGINSLKIGYTSVFGYYLEVTKTNLGQVPQDYIRKQTVAGGERFITQELKDFENKVLSAEEKIRKLEEHLFRQVRARVTEHAAELLSLAAAVAEIDILACFAETAAMRNYCKPEIDDSFDLVVKDGRHPVVEASIATGTFVPNDCELSGTGAHIMLLTGPNMAGKSTYLRQVALISLLAQTGSFVPAGSARCGIIDKIFTRIGAADNLAGGESTFMVEMHETANILNQFTERSLIILDEVGRGTSTYDGISIARATLEHLLAVTPGKARPKVLFATHYFELTSMPQQYSGMINRNVSVKEYQGSVVFMHKILPGAADRSYGIHVAALAGIPKAVVTRAQIILRELERAASLVQNEDIHAPQLALDLDAVTKASETASSLENILVQLSKLNADKMTPLEALKQLAEWKEQLSRAND